MLTFIIQSLQILTFSTTVFAAVNPSLPPFYTLAAREGHTMFSCEAEFNYNVSDLNALAKPYPLSVKCSRNPNQECNLIGIEGRDDIAQPDVIKAVRLALLAFSDIYLNKDRPAEISKAIKTETGWRAESENFGEFLINDNLSEMTVQKPRPLIYKLDKFDGYLVIASEQATVDEVSFSTKYTYQEVGRKIYPKTFNTTVIISPRSFMKKFDFQLELSNCTSN